MIDLIASKVGTVTRLWEDKVKCPGSIPGRKEIFLFSQPSQIALDPTHVLFIGCREFFLERVKDVWA